MTLPPTERVARPAPWVRIPKADVRALAVHNMCWRRTLPDPVRLETRGAAIREALRRIADAAASGAAAVDLSPLALPPPSVIYAEEVELIYEACVPARRTLRAVDLSALRCSRPLGLRVAGVLERLVKTCKLVRLAIGPECELPQVAVEVLASRLSRNAAARRRRAERLDDRVGALLMAETAERLALMRRFICDCGLLAEAAVPPVAL